MKYNKINKIAFVLILLIYIAGQILIGTYRPQEEQFYFDAPADVDFLYYGAIINQLLNDFPPQNPAYAGVKLTQPYLQYVPAALLGLIIEPYNAIRILNLLYFVLFCLLIKKLAPQRYGLAVVILFAASVPGAFINAIGVDFIARGFTHIPFFLLVTYSLFGENMYIRMAALFSASLTNGYLMLIILPFLTIKLLLDRNREVLFILISGIIGTGLSAIVISSEAVNKPFYFIFSESFWIAPWEIIKQAIPFIVLSFFFRHRDMIILMVLAIIFGSFVHYNPFFPVFVVYFSGAMMLTFGKMKIRNGDEVAILMSLGLFITFIFAAVNKYSPYSGYYYPHINRDTEKARNWMNDNTNPDDIFMSVTADFDNPSLLMENRPVFLGFPGHVAHLGLNARQRYNDMTKTYLTGQAPEQVDYIFYGPVEKKYFPRANLPFDTVYKDPRVTIFHTGN